MSPGVLWGGEGCGGDLPGDVCLETSLFAQTFRARE